MRRFITPLNTQRQNISASGWKTGLTIQDDGIGISDLDQFQGMGIKIMKYRATRIGASLDIFKDPEGGTQVVLKMEKEPDL